MTILSDSVIRSALLDSGVRKLRARGRYAHGVYVKAIELDVALQARGAVFTEEELDAFVARLGGQRLEYRALNRLLAAMRLRERQVEYFLPELTYRRVRQSRRGG